MRLKGAREDLVQLVSRSLSFRANVVSREIYNYGNNFNLQ